MRLATDAEIDKWDALIAANPDGGHVLQTRAWGDFKSRWGWAARHVVAETTTGDVAVLFLVRHIPTLGELWYAPKGPGSLDAGQISEIMVDRSLFGDAFLVQIEPEIRASGEMTTWMDEGMRPAAHNVQITGATILVDLRPDEEALLESFKSKTRYNIRLAGRKGVDVRPVEVDDETVDAMFRLMSATQSRAGFTLRKRKYFEDYWRAQSAQDQGQFLFAFLGDEVLAGVFITYFGKRGWYKDGGSTRRHSELMAPHLLQWDAMRWLKQRGVETYDLYAVPPSGDADADHPLFGLYRFKSGFAEEVTEFVGTWELPLRQRAVRLWDRWGNRLAHQWSYRVHRDLFY